MTALAHNHSSAPAPNYSFGPDQARHASLRLASHSNNFNRTRRWQEIAQRIVAWEYDPTIAGDMKPPTADARDMAVQCCNFFADQEAPEPSRAIPNGDGGIIFEWESAVCYVSVEVDADGGWECIVYQDGKIVEKRRS